MGDIRDFYNIHRGKTCLIIGNGPSLVDIPNWFLEMYPSFGANEIFRREGFTPTYYCAVDQKAIVDQWPEIRAAFNDIPKFIPSRYAPLEGERNMYRFSHKSGPGFIWVGTKIGREMLTEPGISYINIAHVSLQIAFYMGFDLMLCVGLDNTNSGEHFYGQAPRGGNPDKWDNGYKVLKREFEKYGRAIINISTKTKAVQLPRGDWTRYVGGGGNVNTN